jgi:transposase
MTTALGVDVGKKTLVAAIWAADGGQALGEFPNDASGFEQLQRSVEQVAGQGPVHLVMEPTGGYELHLMHWAYEAGWAVSLPNPKKVRDWAKGLGMRQKTDGQDALMLARFAHQQAPAPQEPLPEAISELDSLLRRRDDLEKMLAAERNRLESLHHRPHQAPGVRASVQRILDTLSDELDQINRQITTLVADHEDLAQQRRLLLSVPGIGPKTVLPLLVCFHRFRCATRDQAGSKALVAFLGLDAQHHQSGTSVWRRPSISKMGDRQLRSRLYNAALGGIRAQSVLGDFYRALVDRGKPKRLSLVAAARKIAVWAWMVFSTRSPFDPNRAAARQAP